MKILSLIMLTTLMSLTFGQSNQHLLFNDDMNSLGSNVLIEKGEIERVYSAPNYYLNGLVRSDTDFGTIRNNGDGLVAMFMGDNYYGYIIVESTDYYSAPYSMPVTGQAVLLPKIIADLYSASEYFASIPYMGEITEGDYRISFMYKQASGTSSCYGMKWKSANDVYSWSNSKIDEKIFNASSIWQSGYVDVSFYKDSSSYGAYPAIFGIGFEKKSGTTVYIDDIKIQPINTSKKYRIRTHIVGTSDLTSLDGETYFYSLGNRVLLSPDKAYYSNGDTVIVSTMKADGWTFDHYSGDWSSKQEIDTLVVHNDDIDIYARFRKARHATNRIAIITTSAGDYTEVVAAFESGYESAGGTFNAAWISRITTDDADFNKLDSLGYTMLIRPLESPYAKGEWYPLPIIYGTSNAFVWKAMFTKYDEPEVFVSKSTAGTNVAGYNTEFLANQTTTSKAMGYIGGQILFIMDNLDVSFWTARYLLRHSASEPIWGYYNGYGTTNIDSALAIYDFDFDYDSLDPYMDYIPEQQIYLGVNVVPYPSQRRSERFSTPIQNKLLRTK